MLPAQQRFIAGHRLAGDIDQRLDIQPKLTAADRVAKVAGQDVAFVQLGIHPGLKHFPLAAPVLLDRVERDIGIGGQLGALIGVEWRQRDPD